MTWLEARAALQLEAELQVGVAQRAYERIARATEDAAWAKAAETYGRMEG